VGDIVWGIAWGVLRGGYCVGYCVGDIAWGIAQLMIFCKDFRILILKVFWYLLKIIFLKMYNVLIMYNNVK
jgi:hypothetical protein